MLAFLFWGFVVVVTLPAINLWGSPGKLQPQPSARAESRLGSSLSPRTKQTENNAILTTHSPVTVSDHSLHKQGTSRNHLGTQKIREGGRERQKKLYPNSDIGHILPGSPDCHVNT